MYASSTGRVIVFCQTKAECDELANAEELKMEVKPLHGDIPQSAREKTMAAFRAGTITTRCEAADWAVLLRLGWGGRLQADLGEGRREGLQRAGSSGRRKSSPSSLAFQKPFTYWHRLSHASGKFRVLVATDVAARGLDVLVELVVQNQASLRTDDQLLLHPL